MKKFALVTVSYNSFTDIQKLSKSIDDVSLKSDLFDWILIDNFSSDREDVEALELLCKQKGYVFIQSDKNGGFAYGSNLGIEYALKNEYQYIGLINPDCIFTQTDFLQKLEVKFLENKDILTPLITYFPDVDKVYSAGGSVNQITMLTKMHGKGDLISSVGSQDFKCDFATGCALFAKREVFESVGLIPEEYFLYFEEADWCQKATREGFEMFFVSKAQIAHGVSTSIGYLSKVYIYYMIRNYPIFAKKYILWYYLPIFYLFYVFVWCGGYCFILLKNKKLELIKYVFKGFFNSNI